MVRAFIIAGLCCGTAQAQTILSNTIILSEKFGRPMTIGSQNDAREALGAGELSGVGAADAFHALCLAGGFDSESFEKAAQASPLGLEAQDVVLEPVGKTPAYTQHRFAGPSVFASWWAGDAEGLKNRPIVIRDRGGSTTGGYGPFKAFGRQCNVSIKLARVGDLQAMADRLGTIIGGSPIKVVVKPKWADGSWSIPGSTRRVSFAVIDATQPAALVHFTVQEIEGAKP